MKHLSISLALRDALATIWFICGLKLKFLSQQTPRSVTVETDGKIKPQRLYGALHKGFAILALGLVRCITVHFEGESFNCQ